LESGEQAGGRSNPSIFYFLEVINKNEEKKTAPIIEEPAHTGLRRKYQT